jgi:hypothetical protein
MSADELARLKRGLRWHQYRLRTLLIVMTVLAAWLSIASYRARQQKFVVERIRAFGGRGDYGHQSITNLKMLYIPDSQISDEGRLKLQQTLPNAGIWDWPINVFPWPARARVTISPEVEKWGRTISAGDAK